MFTIAVPTLLMVPSTLFICGLKNTEKNTSVKPKMENAGISDLFKRAFKNRSYIFIGEYPKACVNLQTDVR